MDTPLWLRRPFRETALTAARDRMLGGYLRKWVTLGVLIGVVAGVGAILFFVAIDLATDLFLGGLAGLEPPVPRGEGVTEVSPVGRRWVLPLVVGLGGLISGLVVFTLAPEAEGHGTDAAIEAFHQRAGRIRARIPAVKLLASAVTIGSGGSAGREGPTAQIAAGFGSWLGSAFRLSPEDRRIALAVGVGAGIGAIFKAPLGSAILSAEILYLRDFELEAIVPGFIASVVGYTIFASWSGWEPVFGSGLGFHFADPGTLGWYAALGLACGAAGIVYVRAFYRTRDLFYRLPLPRVLKPALAGLIVGGIAIWFPQVLSMGYGWLQLAVEGDTAQLAAGTMLALVALKIVATSLTIGSGGSGGVFAPGLFIGGMLGGGLWSLLDGSVPGLPPEPEPFVVVGMGALFGGIANAPIAVMLMVAEMTGEFTMIVPAMIAVSVSYLVTGPVSIYEHQLPRRADSPAHRGEHTIPLIQTIHVAQAMQREPRTVEPEAPIGEAERILEQGAMRGVPVVADGRLVGILTATDVLRGEVTGARLVREVMHADPLVAYPTDTLHTALQRMTRIAISVLPVVERERPDRLVGLLSITELARVLDLQVNELAARPEHVRSSADDPLRYVTVDEVMAREFDAVPLGMPLREAAERLAISGRHAALVLDEDGALAGIVSVQDLERVATGSEDGRAAVEAAATRRVVVAHAGQFVAEALSQPGAEAARQLPVVKERDGRLYPVGLLRRHDVLLAYLRGREHIASGSVRTLVQNRQRAEDVVSSEVPVERTDRANGLTLADLGLPAGAVITSVERDGTMLVPRGQLRLLAGDRVRILSTKGTLTEAIRRLQGERPAGGPPGMDVGSAAR